MAPGTGLREWAVELRCDATADVQARATALARWLWGSSSWARCEGRTLRVLAPSQSSAEDLARAVERGEGVPERWRR